MKYAFTLTLLLFALFSFPQSATLNQLTEKEKEQGWELLFNGENLANWKIFNAGEITGWKIIDGVLYNSGVGSDHGGDIITKKKYQNFELYLEWKVAPESNSGVFFHVEEGKVKALYESGPEYQLIDDKGWTTPLESDQYSGANYAMHAPKNAKVNGIDEWNSSRIVVNEKHVEHFLNGLPVVKYELWSKDWEKRKEAGKWKNFPYYGTAKTGHIGLQDHGGLTQFRNIKIRKL